MSADSAPLLMITQRLTERRAADARLVLPYDLRSRSRFRAKLEGGEWVGVVLTRGRILRGGDLLLAADGRAVEVGAALECVTTVRAADAHGLARAAYHLGNRHVALQIGAGWLRYRHDHVLDDMVRGLGLQEIVEQAAFEPEAGAYHDAAGGGHGHSHHHHELGTGDRHQHTGGGDREIQGHCADHRFEEGDGSGTGHDHHENSIHDEAHDREVGLGYGHGR